MIFVVGTGRSGTHWLGWILEEHPDVRATIEHPPIFRRVTEAAMCPDLAPGHLRYLRRRYRWEQLLSWPKDYVDKSHPNLWHTEQLAKWFPSAKFVAMRRGVEATVASMLRHDGVMKWHRKWREYPVPNQFLGITAEMVEDYDGLPNAAKCAIRWKAHSDRIDALTDAMGPDRFLVVEYEDMAASFENRARQIWSFLGLKPQSVNIRVKTESLDKWRDQLSDGDLHAIHGVVG